MKVHISYETDEEREAAMDVFEMLDNRFPNKKRRYKEKHVYIGTEEKPARGHSYYTIIDKKKRKM